MTNKSQFYIVSLWTVLYKYTKINSQIACNLFYLYPILKSPPFVYLNPPEAVEVILRSRRRWLSMILEREKAITCVVFPDVSARFCYLRVSTGSDVKLLMQLTYVILFDCKCEENILVIIFYIK